MTNTFNYALDKLMKITLLLLLAVPAIGWHWLMSNLNSYTSDLSDEIQIYYNLTYDGLLLVAFFTTVILFPLCEVFKHSKHNTLGIERGFANFCRVSQPGNYPTWLFYLSITLMYGFGMYCLLEFVLSVGNSAQLHQHINQVTMEANGFGSTTITTRLIQSFLLIGIMIAVLVTKPDEDGGSFLLGFFVVPIFFSVPSALKYFFTDSDTAAEKLEGLLSIHLGLGHGLNIMGGVLAAALVVCAIMYARASKLDMKKQSLLAVGGFTASFIAGVVSTVAIHYGPSMKTFTENPNVIQVDVHGTKYTINQSLISEMDNDKTEFLIEAYSGLSMHNATWTLEWFAQGHYEADVEKGLRFSADVLLQNLRKYEAKSKKVDAFLTSGPLNFGSAFPFIIQWVVYQASPLDHQERALESIIAGRYQDAVDFYIEDAINRTEEESLPIQMKNREHQTRTSSHGHGVLQAIIHTLTTKGYAELDYDKVNPDKREELKERMAYWDDGSSETIEPELIEEWFNIFKTDRLFEAQVATKTNTASKEPS
ncbi:hypothetical protein [Neptuniibacter sp. QD37_11]|uniref:hypothetical protein n=1 Tax=Neptuniibacter sp. QD37_11 TaxID=3398209 RepID=UPI0039F499CE